VVRALLGQAAGRVSTLVPFIRPLELVQLPGRLATYAARAVCDRYGYYLNVQVAIDLSQPKPVLTRVMALTPLTCPDCGLYVKAGDEVSHRFDPRVKVEMVDAARRSIEKEEMPC
jgi:hypothetical protein